MLLSVKKQKRQFDAKRTENSRIFPCDTTIPTSEHFFPSLYTENIKFLLICINWLQQQQQKPAATARMDRGQRQE